MTTARFLQEQPLFGGVDDQAMAAILPLMRELTFAAGDVMRFQALGQQLAILINGTPVVGITDTTWASGYAGCGGVVGIAGNMEFDDWSVLEFSAGRGF